MVTDFDSAIAVTREIFWVGFYDAHARLHCNPYLLIDSDDVVLIDPGSIPHFPIVMRKIMDIVNPEDITYIIASHQDPDVCGNLAVVEDVVNNKNLKIVGHSNTIRLIRHLGIRSDFYTTDKNNDRLILDSGRELQFIPTQYLHAPGAIATYDIKSKSLFTSDIFAAMSDNWTLFAEGDFLSPMKKFHQAYMPSNQVLRHCMERFEKMSIDKILPQHGSVLEGDDIAKAINYLKTLPCGIDLMVGEQNS
ncbi:MAG: MBL fold metallo-hydrolase [Gammaproteobacteria bacterium]|nr:MBL fold metallo-hydrolase [Gammaproteobacteria bacterium]